MPINLTYYLKSRQIKEIYNGTNQSQATNNLKLKGFFFLLKTLYLDSQNSPDKKYLK